MSLDACRSCFRRQRLVSPEPGAHSAAPSRTISIRPVPSAPPTKCRSARATRPQCASSRGSGSPRCREYRCYRGQVDTSLLRCTCLIQAIRPPGVVNWKTLGIRRQFSWEPRFGVEPRKVHGNVSIKASAPAHNRCIVGSACGGGGGSGAGGNAAITATTSIIRTRGAHHESAEHAELALSL